MEKRFSIEILFENHISYQIFPLLYKTFVEALWLSSHLIETVFHVKVKMRKWFSNQTLFPNHISYKNENLFK